MSASGSVAYLTEMKRFLMHIAKASAAIACAMYPADSALAQLSITEVMFDPVGTDTKHEWIEVKNDATGPVDVSAYKLVESGTSHKITLFGTGTTIIENDGFAVIADDPTTFMADFPGFVGRIFDSTFSLSNTGEALALSFGDGIVDTVTYDPAIGGAGTGASLQKQPDGAWLPAKPTPSATNSSEKYDGESSSETGDGTSTGSGSSSSGSSGGSSSSTQSAHASPVSVSTYTPKTDFQISIGRERLVPVHTPVEFRAVAKDDTDFSVHWTFGDGTDKRGTKAIHTYILPATYAVVANAREGDSDIAVDRTKVTVFEPQIDVGYATTSGYWLKNRSGKELNIGGFEARLSKEAIRWPADTIVLDGQPIPLPFSEGLGEPCQMTIRFSDGTKLLPLNCL